MKILQINLTYKNGSTGKIMYDINQTILGAGYESYMLYAYSTFETPSNAYKMYQENMSIAVRKHLLESRITGRMGYGKKAETAKVLRWIESIKPDIIHLHNIHGNWINLKILFAYIKENKIPVVWTLHDCWPFTGRCSHFENVGCEKWKNGCKFCENKRVYPITYFFDFSKKMWKNKKEWFTAVDDMTIITPSEWLAKYVHMSYFKEFNIKVINNGIDLNVFKPYCRTGKYLTKYGNKKIILGVASSWTERKGLKDFEALSRLLNKEVYQIVLVGLNKRQLKKVPREIVGIERTNNATELAEIYTSADVFVNLTYLDNYPTVNLEAIACGTPVITYDTGGSPESVSAEVGIIVEQGDIDKLAKAIITVCNSKKYETNKLASYASENFDKTEINKKYINEYISFFNLSSQ